MSNETDQVLTNDLWLPEINYNPNDDHSWQMIGHMHPGVNNVLSNVG